MAVAYDNRRLVDGPAEVLFGDGVTTLATDAGGSNTTTVLEMVSDPAAAGFRAGDCIKVSGGSEVRKIASISGSDITVETAFTAAPTPGDDIVRVGVHAGYTEGGIMLKSKTNLQERMADQSLDPISVKADKRDSSITFNMLEIFKESVTKAFMLDASAVTVSGGVTKFKVGNSSLTLNTTAVLILGTNENGEKVTVFASKCANQGEAAITFAKDKAATLPMDLKLINDSSRPTGEELYVMEFGPTHNLSYLA